MISGRKFGCDNLIRELQGRVSASCSNNDVLLRKREGDQRTEQVPRTIQVPKTVTVQEPVTKYVLEFVIGATATC